MNRGSGSGGGLGSLLGGALGQGGAGGAGGLGDLLGSLAGGGAAAGGAGGLGDLLGKLQGGQPQANAGGDSGMLGQIFGAEGQQQPGGGLGGLLGSALGQQAPGAQQPQATAEQTDHAALLIRAMINSAKADGTVDAQEQEKIVGKLGEIGPEEAAFIRAEMQSPLNVQEFIQSVPRGMEQQVYALSLMSVNLDSKAEADYLDQLAKGFGISEQASNQLHTQLGVPALYT